MIAGQGEATRAVDRELDGLPDGEFQAIGVRMDGGNGENGAAGKGQGAVVARLAATAGIAASL